MTNDEKVALVETAKGIVEEEISVIKTFDLLTKINTAGSGFIQVQSKQLNSWLANRSFFARHEGVKADEPAIKSLCCYTCSQEFSNGFYVFSPCDEAVTTADLIVNGVVIRHYCAGCGDYIPEGVTT